MKVMVTGANGFLGQHLVRALSAWGYAVIAAGRGTSRTAGPVRWQGVDLTDRDEVVRCMEATTPDVIVHTAAMSKPDECQADPNACLRHNVGATRFLLEAAATSSRFIHISTDFIFGDDGPFAENDAPGPVNFYGESKLMAETIVQQTPGAWTIVRPVFIYGATWPGIRPGFIQWVKTSLAQGKEISVVNDQLRTPTYVSDLCKGIHSIIEREAGGIYHLAGKDTVTPYELAVCVAEELSLDASLVRPVDSGSFPEPVRRPKYSALKIDKAGRELGYDPVDVREGIRQSFEQSS